MADEREQMEKGSRNYGRIAYSSKIKRRRKLKRLMLLAIAVLVAVLVIGVAAVRNAIVQSKEKDKEGDKKEVHKTEVETKTAAEKKAEKITAVKEEAVQAGCPEGIIALIDKNEETLNFVSEYSEKKDLAPPEALDESEIKEGIPALLQWDSRWGYASYGTSTIAASGCGPTCMSMVIAGLTGDLTATPYRMAKFSEENSYLDETNNTYWLFMNKAAEGWGISCKETRPNESTVIQELSAGHPIICSVGPGDFTTSGHFIVLTGYHDGMVKVNDPFSKTNSEKEWLYANIAGQISEMWIYSKE